MGIKVVEIMIIFDVLKLWFCLCLLIVGERILEYYGWLDVYKFYLYFYLIEFYYVKLKLKFKNCSFVFINYIINIDIFEIIFLFVRNGVFLVKLYKIKER